jgi:hypothetical protein
VRQVDAVAVVVEDRRPARPGGQRIPAAAINRVGEQTLVPGCVGRRSQAEGLADQRLAIGRIDVLPHDFTGGADQADDVVVIVLQVVVGIAERRCQRCLRDLADELVNVARAVDVVRDATLGRAYVRIVVQIALAVEGLLSDRELLADVGDCGARGQQSVGLAQLGDDLIGGVFFAFHRESPFPRQRHSRCRSGDSHSNWCSFREAGQS